MIFCAPTGTLRSSKPPERALVARKPVPNEAKLAVYGLYKQATTGDVATARPGGFLNFEANAKWDAHAALKGVPPAEAKARYIEEVARQQRDFA